MNNILKKQVSVIIPSYNESGNIWALIQRLAKTLRINGYRYELIVIDDNSTDATKEIVMGLTKTLPVIFESKKGKKGKAYSLIEGFSKATGDIIVMIDGDLQYTPEAIPGMIEALSNDDIVVANRKQYNDSFARKVFSNTFRTIFGKALFGLHHDIQSGLKAFKREVIETISFNPSSQWTFDLEFLHRAHQAGFSIANFDIVFEKRKTGSSSVRFIKTTIDIGVNALKLRAKRIHPIAVKPKNSKSMMGAGMRYKKNFYVTHTTLPHKVSAIRTFTLLQKNVILSILLIIAGGLVFRPLITLQALVAALSTIYFIDVLFNLFVILKSLSFPQEITSTDEEIAALKDKDLPVYSILCPLYREAHVVPQFMEAIGKLSYPKDKLDVLLLLEEDDKDTVEKISRMNLPVYVRVIVVPHSMPKTKPKACNYGLAFAKGEYLVIFDAEDIPEPLQLKKALLGFGKVPANTICLQAKLNYYNPHQNLLTRFFTAEYSLWFDVTLTGLQSINTTIPLGGTSNHFRTEKLREVEGWDPFNVTEDADLGMRLFKKGYKTAIIDSITLEEANSKYGNWLRQRSRWIKGYMQTYLVHIRETLTFTKEQGVHSLIFQLIIGGKIAFVLINPFLWLATISYFTLYAYVGPQIEALYPSYVFYMALFSLVFGNFLFFYYYMIGVAKKGQWNLMKFIFLIPFYWIMISISAFIALYQLVFKPHYWEKTVHGFHLTERAPITIVKQSRVFRPSFGTVGLILKKANSLYTVRATKWVAKKAVISPLSYAISIFFIDLKSIIFSNKLTNTNNDKPFQDLTGKQEAQPKIFKKRILRFLKSKMLYLSGIILVTATMGGNVLNFVFNVYLGRKLSLELFGELSLFTSLLYLASIPLGSYSATISHNIAFLYGKYSEKHARGYLKYIFGKSMIFGVVLSVLWAISIPYLSHFFQIDNDIPILLFTPIWIISFASSNFSGYLAGTLSFGKKGLLLLVEASVRLLIAFILITVGFSNIVYLSIVASLASSFALGWLMIGKRQAVEISQNYKKFNFLFFVTSNLSGISLITFLTLDVVLVKHFLTPMEAGQYGLLSLLGKMTYFLGSLFGPFMIPLVSHNEGAKKDSKKTFIFLFVITFIFSAISFILLGIFGGFFATLIFGIKAKAIISLLSPYILSMALFTISQPIVSYFQAKEAYSFAIIGFIVAIFQIGLTILFHKDLSQIVYVMLSTSAINLLCIILLSYSYKKLWILKSNLKDFIDLLIPNKKRIDPGYSFSKNNILIFNWRDTKHRWAGGAEVYVHEISKRWVADGNRVTIFCGNDGLNARNEIIDGIRIVRRGGFYMVYFWAALYYVFKFRGKYDFIIDSENGIPFFTPLYAKEKKFLLIHHVHQEVFRHSLKWPLSQIALFLEARLMPFVYRKVQVITVSPSSKEEIMRHKLTKKEPIIIYNGVDLEVFKPGKKSEKPMVLYLGRLQYYKGLHVFIVAAKRILKRYSNAEFVIAGEGGEKEKLIKFAEKLGVADKVKFVGKVAEEEKVQLFQKAWIFVNPSLMEGWGITTIEANACGTPAVASDVPGLRDSIKSPHTGILVPYKKYDGFTRTITKLIHDEKLRKKMSGESIKWASNFSWEKSANEFYSALNKSIEDKQEKKIRRGRLSFAMNMFTSLF